MAKTPKSKDLDIPEDWEVHEEELPKEKKKREFNISNNVLWLIFIVILVAFASLPFLKDAVAPPTELTTIEVNGIPISAIGDPERAIKNLGNYHIQGKQLDQTPDSHDALNEILVIIGQTMAPSAGGSYTLFAGVSDKTGITIDGKSVSIEGTNRRYFWTAIWTFTTIYSNTEIISDVPWYDVQNLLEGKDRAYLVQDMDGTCPAYAYVISAEGDLMSSLGYKQAQYGFELSQYQESEGRCYIAVGTNETGFDCPTPSSNDFVITMHKGDSDTIKIGLDSMDFEFSSCATVGTISVIPRDLLHPNIVTDLADINIPMQL